MKIVKISFLEENKCKKNFYFFKGNDVIFDTSIIITCHVKKCNIRLHYDSVAEKKTFKVSDKIQFFCYITLLIIDKRRFMKFRNYVH